MNKINNFFFTVKNRGLSKALYATKQNINGFLLKILGKRYIKRNIYSFQMILDLYDKGISRALWLFGDRELEHKYLLEKVIKPGMTILDIGSNIGYYPLMELNLIGKNGKLISVEPSNSNIELLKKNLSLNNFHEIEIHEGAVSDKEAEKDFFLSTQSNLNTFHNIGTGINHLSGEIVKVKTQTISSILNGRAVDLIRMDVEGHEVEVLNGMISSIDKFSKLPMIIFETHISRYTKDHDFKKTLNDLFNLKYRVSFVGSSSARGSNTISEYGYKSIKDIKSDGEERKIFKDIKNKDAIELICLKGGIRTVLLTPSNK
tara:strand:- start:185 stop:1135 length:951 start_codon:yes stop_codon:yes gene_type:complete